MHVFKKFVKYYKPYQSVFWMDMFCALLVSAVDLAFPQTGPPRISLRTARRQSIGFSPGWRLGCW